MPEREEYIHFDEITEHYEQQQRKIRKMKHIMCCIISFIALSITIIILVSCMK
jgi:hypothetical protein